MNINKFTQKSLQAVQNCERIAMDYGNQEIAQEHLLYALLTQDDSLIAKLMEKMGLDPNTTMQDIAKQRTSSINNKTTQAQSRRSHSETSESPGRTAVCRTGSEQCTGTR